MKKLTHEEFIRKLESKGIKITPLEEYINSSTKILCRCDKCGYKWKVKPNSILTGKGCPQCNNHKYRTEKDFLKEVYEIHDNIQILDNYKNMNTNINCKCLNCNTIWETTPTKLIHCKYGCPECNGNKKKTNEQFLRELYEINPNIQPLEEYVNNRTKILCRCLKCGYEWKVTPTHLISSKSGCKYCKSKENGMKKRKDPEEFKIQLQEINPTIKLLSEYSMSADKIKCECLICGHKWSTKASDLLRGIGCPGCVISKGELIIMNYLNTRNITFLYDIPYFDDLYGISGIRLLRPDFILPEHNIWIEFDGRQHFEPVNFKNNKDVDGANENFKKIVDNDNIKNKYAIDNGWIMIRISYMDYDYIEEILDEYLLERDDNDEYIG